MEKLRATIAEHSSWSTLEEYVERIDAFKEADFSQALENAKALLESVGKHICSQKGVVLTSTVTMNGVLKNSFMALGYTKTSLVAQVSSALGTIGQQMGELRNEIGITGHGKTMDELRERNSKVDRFTREFLIDSVELVSCMLISAFENNGDVLRVVDAPEGAVTATDPEFEANWNELFGNMEMGEYVFPAALILNKVEPTAYLKERELYYKNKPKDDDGG